MKNKNVNIEEFIEKQSGLQSSMGLGLYLATKQNVDEVYIGFKDDVPYVVIYVFLISYLSGFCLVEKALALNTL